jgi:molybdenum cofactor cytidylyltransferase
MGHSVKQLLPWGKLTLIEHMKKVAMASGACATVVVLGAHAGRIREVLGVADKCHIIENTAWQEGLSASIAFGIQYLELNFPASDGVLLMLCDQPLLTTSYLNRMMDAFSQGDKKIVASNYGSVPGVPAIFDRQYFGELQMRDNQGGAQGLLVKYRSGLQLLNPGLQVLDMDIPEDYEKLLRLYKDGDMASDNR